MESLKCLFTTAVHLLDLALVATQIIRLALLDLFVQVESSLVSLLTILVSVPPCIFTTSPTWYLAVVPVSFSKTVPIQYALSVTAQPTVPTVVTLDSTGKYATTGAVGEDQYNHYQLTLAANQLQFDSVLNVLLYVNFDTSPVSLILNEGSLAGEGDCYAEQQICTTSGTNPTAPTSCHFNLQRCNLTAATYYFSVYGQPTGTSYGQPIAYTIKWAMLSTL
jgi:hypothetical protein